MIVDIVDKYCTDDNNPIKNLRLIMPTTFLLLPSVFCHPPPPFCLLPFPFLLPPSAFCLLPPPFCLPSSAFSLLPSSFYLPPSTFVLLPTPFCCLPSPTPFYVPFSPSLFSLLPFPPISFSLARLSPPFLLSSAVSCLQQQERCLQK
jgi:hypothetical protein